MPRSKPRAMATNPFLPKKRHASQTRASVSASIQAANRKRRQEALDTLDDRMAEARCRRLAGAEFLRRKAEFEARERAMQGRG